MPHTPTRRGRLARHAVLAIAGLCIAASAHAQFDPSYYIDLSAGLMRTQQLNRLLDASAKQSQEAARAGTPPRPPADRTVRMPAAPVQLAAAYPAGKRAEVQRVFEELLQRYEQIERQFGIPHDDVAGALAAFVAGNHMAYRNADFPDEHFKPLVSQLDRGLARQPQFAGLPVAERRQVAQQLAILGMLMAASQMAHKENPSAEGLARMKQAASGYLQVLGIDADRLQIGPQGMSTGAVSASPPAQR